MKIIELAGKTDALGDLVITSTKKIVGHLEKIEMVYDDGDTGADVTFTSEGPISQPLTVITNAGVASLTWYPRTLANKADGTAFTDVAEKIFIVGQPKVVIASGGNSKNFRFLVYVSDE